MASIWAIRRSTTDAKLTGLCGGAARHWGVDPVLVRVGCALLALSGGIGLILYLAGWLLIPVDGKDRSTLDDLVGRQSSRWPREAWVAIVVVACMVSFALFSPLMPFGFAPAVILAVIWYFGYYKTRSGTPVSPASPAPAPPLPPTPAAESFRYPGPPTPFTEAAEAWQRRIEENLRRAGTPAAASTPAASTTPVSTWPSMPTAYADVAVSDPPPAEELERAAFLALPDPVGLYTEPVPSPSGATPSRITQAGSTSAHRLRLVGLVVLGLVLAGLGVAERLGADVPLTAYFGGALLVVGLTLVAATWLGRARGILPVGLLVLLALVSVTVARPYGSPREWAQEISYTTVSQLPAAGDHQEVGKLRVDLSQLALSRSATYTAHVGTGSLEVTAPADANVRVRYAVQRGVMLADGAPVTSGENVHGVLEPEPAKAGVPTLTLDLSTDLGEVRVTR